MRGFRYVLLSIVVASVALPAARGRQATSQPRTYDASLYGGLRWRMLGPFRGGRVNAVTGVPGQPGTFYFGSVGGGVWKTTSAGRTWTPIFDSQPVASIGAIAVAPSNPNIIYVGTGEADMRSQISYGNGVYRSTDAGATWKHLGLDRTRQIGRVIVDPKNPDVVFVAALGHVYGPNPDRGVYRSRDGGATWQKVLFKSNDIGAIDLAFDPKNTRVVYAALWNTRRPPWSIYPPSYGPGSGLYKSADGGTTWNQLTKGLPTEGLGRIGIAVAPANARRVYAIVDAKEGGLYRSDDAGATWTKASGDQRLWSRGWYFCKIAVDPKNADIVYVPNVAFYRSKDGGRTWGAPIKGSPGGDDYQGLWIDPSDPNRIILASDQGTVITVNASDEIPTWTSWLNQPTAQMYHVAPDYRFPYWLTGAQQDSGAVGVASRSRFAGISMRDWAPLCAGGESGYTAPDPLHPEILFGGTVTRCNVLTGKTDNVSPERGMQEPARHTWTVPLVFSPADPHALYFGNQFIFKTADGGGHWTQISPDLSREDPGVPPNLDAATAADAPSGKRRGVVYSIAPSPVSAALIWVGTDDGLIHVTRDDGKTWEDVTPRELTPWSKVVMIDASHFDPSEAYAAIDRHRLEDNEPYVYRTRDGGKTWQKIAKGLTPGVYMQTVKEDPKRRGLLYAGTELGVFVSFDDGDDWQPLQSNLPAVSVRDIAIKDDDVIVATHGRGFWAIDNGAAVLRQLDATAASSDVVLFKPSDAFILPPATDNGTPTQKDEPQAENPPAGALIDYYLKSAATAPLSIEIVDGSGDTVRRYSSDDPPVVPNAEALTVSPLWAPSTQPLPATAGLHRWVWDLRGTAQGGGRAGGRGGRGGAPGGGGGFGRGGAPFTQPGTYTVRLTVSGRSYTQTVTVKADPR